MSYSQGKGGRLYPAYSVSGSDCEDNDSGSPAARSRHHQHQYSQHTYQHPLYQQPTSIVSSDRGADRGGGAAGLSDTPTSENASDATLTDSELALARDSTLLVHNGCLLDGVPRPPDVPPRNPTMNRSNGRIGGANNASQDGDFEPSCLVRTPSGNVYIPTGTLNMPKNSTMDYKSNSSCSSPSKDRKSSDRCNLPFGTPVPVLPVRNNLRRPNSSHFPPASRFHFRKGIAGKCTWKCTAIVFIILSVVLTAALSYMSASNLLNWSYQNTKACTVLVGENNEAPLSAAKATSETNHSSSNRPRLPSTEIGSVAGASSAGGGGVSGAGVGAGNVGGSSSGGKNEVVRVVKTTAGGRSLRERRHVAVPLPGRRAEEDANMPSSDRPTSEPVAVVVTLHDDPTVFASVTTPRVHVNGSISDCRANCEEGVDTTAVYGPESDDVVVMNADEVDRTPTDASEDVDSSETVTSNSDDFTNSISIATTETVDTTDTTDETGEAITSFITTDGSCESCETTTSKSNTMVQDVDSEHEKTLVRSRATETDRPTTKTVPNVTLTTQKDGPEAFQQDYPIFAYGSDEVEIIGLGDSGEKSPKHNSEEKQEPDIVSHDDEISSTSTSTSTPTLNITTPANTTPVVIDSKIDTDEKSKNEFVSNDSVDKHIVRLSDKTKHLVLDLKLSEVDDDMSVDTETNYRPVYVLTLSLANDKKSAEIKTSQVPRQREEPVIVHPQQSGGECECSCPCMDDNYDADYDQRDVTDRATGDIGENEIRTESIPTDRSEKDISSERPTTQSDARSTSDEGNKLFPARSFPPDGTTFSQISLGRRLSKEIPPYGYWNMQFYQSEAAYVRFDYGIPRGASIGAYARRNALPTHTQYDILEVLSGFKARTTRASHASMKKEATHYMEQGHWFLSLYNDDGDPQEVSFLAAVADDMTRDCPNGCGGKGECLMGHCQCDPGFGGDDCSESVCPVLCGRRGEYVNGECQCNPGWKGKECSLRHDECEVPDCNGHGRCDNGKCACSRGYKGKFCEEVDCPHPNCNGHGFCIEGTCICKKGWKGSDCGQTDKDALQCLPDCSTHGTFDLDTQTCRCEPRWSGDDCSRELCDLDCGPHGRCVGDGCACDAGWTGERCDAKRCDARCDEHGQCKNGTCLCVTGWNGKHCTMEGCPNACSNHGQCRVNVDAAWECRCYDGWDGRDCGVLLEQNCDDGRDNDRDGLVDCEDPECCSDRACRSSQLCVTSPKPIDILLRKQPPAITASFFERMKFLIDEGGLQNYARHETFNESRSAVVRGRVITALGAGLMGVRVSTSTLLEGFTLTRDDGWFDLLVNGGGAVTLQFGRAPFRPQTRVTYAPWNEVVIIDDVIMSTTTTTTSSNGGDERRHIISKRACAAHDYDAMKPVVLATWKHGFQGACPDRSAILAESQVVQESLRVPGTGLHLVYHSSRAAGYLSTIQLQLTPATIPPTLALVRLRITIEGILFERSFEADPAIRFTYAWNRLNVYRQRVYGVTTAIVKVGYVYSDCDDTIWDVQTTKLSGHDMSVSEVGGWNLDVHHRYNFHEGILQKGDGSNIYLKHKPRVIVTTMGDGHQRPLECADCEGRAAKQRLLAPVALAAAPDGSIFVGDFDLVRRILPDGSVRTVVRLNATRVSYRYHLALSPVDGTLYISDPESHRIVRVRDTSDYSDPEHNWEPAVGSGERCLPGDEAHCGDGALARDAKLAYPKGVAVSADNVLYFADGTNVRAVDRDGIVTTVIGDHAHKSHWRPLPCEGTLSVAEVRLRWPTELAISPLDDSLHVVDDHMVLRLASDGRVKVIAGRPLHCAPLPLGTGSANGPDAERPLATRTTLVMPQSIAFGPSGRLYVAESDSQRVNRVRVVGTDGRIAPFAGADSKCNCLERGCDCIGADRHLAASARFDTISSVAVGPDGILHVADQANYRVRSVTASIPDSGSSREYEIYAPDSQEVYVFNRFGQHVATRDILTGETVYLFTYNVNTSNGKLSTVTDSAGNKVFLLRDYSSSVNSIENTEGQKCRLRMTRMRMLHELSTPDNYNVTFDYHGATGLLKSRLDGSGRGYVYTYDEFGRLTSAVTPTGRAISLSFDLSVDGATVTIRRDADVGDAGAPSTSMLIRGASVVTRVGESRSRAYVSPDGSVVSVSPSGQAVATDTARYTVLADIDPLLGESYPVPAKQRTEIGGDVANRFEWRYYVHKPQRQAGNNGSDGVPSGDVDRATGAVRVVGRRLRVNGENLLTFEYDRTAASLAVILENRVALLNVTYDRTARPIKWTPRDDAFAGVELEYDRYGRLTSWRRGELNETYSFDRAGRLNEIKYGDGSSTIYTFKDSFSSLPLKVTTPRGSDYLLQYDDAGALRSLTTPRGHIHAFSLQTSLGFYKYRYYAPTNRHPYEILYDDDGRILAKAYPHQSGKVAYAYDRLGRLEASLAGGLSSIHYAYHESTHLLRAVDIVEPDFELRREFKYHAGVPKDERWRFGARAGLDDAHFRFQYDGNARPSGVDVDIGGKRLPQLRYKYEQSIGSLEGVGDLRVYRSAFNRSVTQDGGKQFFTISERDAHGRQLSTLVNIKSFEVFRLEIEYDARDRVSGRRLLVGRTTSSERIAYNADGHVLEVLVDDGVGGWKYVYDENGNIVGVIDGGGEKVALGYDSGDRVVRYGDTELNAYDARGFVVRRGEQRYRYDARGLLVHAVERDRFETWYRYDDRARLVAWRDDRGNVTQFLYANPREPTLVTHAHFPHAGKTFRFMYGAERTLLAVETSEQRFYVAADQNGSPLALFDTNGNVVKAVRRTPFGRIVRDSNPDFYLPVDFHGGIYDPYTRLVYIEGRPYDPLVGQWMTPAWEQLAEKLARPTDVFIYRFRDNDPIGVRQRAGHMTDLNEWLALYGYDFNAMLGSRYAASAAYHPSATVARPRLAPEFAVVSGLRCVVDKIDARFADAGFAPRPALKMEPKSRELLPRVAHRRSVFGEGVLVSRVGGRASVSVVDGVNGVVQDVVTSVFNDSHFLDLHFSVHDQDIFYFVKDNPLKIRDDTEELRRLGGMFNVTTHEPAEGGSAGKELRLHDRDAVVVVRYGVDPAQERHRILKHAHKRAVERAWELEKQLVAAGLQGRGDWTEEEKEELVSHGDVDGYEGVDIRSVHRYPQLADDPGNVAFKRDAKRKRRKSGGAGRRLGRRS